MATSIYIPTNSVGRFSFLHIFANFCYVFDDNYPKCDVVLVFISLKINNVEHPFMYLLAICMSSLEKFLPPHFYLVKLFY